MTTTTQTTKCASRWCKNPVYEGGSNLCLKCEDLMLEAQMEAKYYQEGEEMDEYD